LFISTIWDVASPCTEICSSSLFVASGVLTSSSLVDVTGFGSSLSSSTMWVVFLDDFSL